MKIFIKSTTIIQRGSLREKDLFIGIYSPERRLIEFQVEMKNIKGALSKVSNIIAKLGINICSGFITAYPEKPDALFSFIADITNVNITTEQVVEKLKKLDIVLKVSFYEPKIKGFMIDNLHFPILVLGERSLTFRIESIGRMFKRLYEIFGSGASFIIYQMGLALGGEKVERLRSKYNMSDEEILSIILNERIAKGWGIPELIDFSKIESRAIIRVYELFECLPFKGKEKEAKSYFFKGYLEGVLAKIFGKEVKISEEKCIAKGDDYCEFTYCSL